jgi:preprotein translocase subunit SecD
VPPANRSSRTGSQTHPGRFLLVFAIIVAGLATWALWPGQDNVVRLGLDLRGGTQVILQPKAVQEGASITDDQLAQTVAIIRQRVDGVGVAEAEVTVQGSGDSAAIIVSVPDVSQERLVELVGRTALLDFRPVWTILGPAPVGPDGTPIPAPDAGEESGEATSARIVQSAENSPEFEADVAALDCLDAVNQAGGSPDDPELWLGTCDQNGAAKYSLQPAFIKGTNVTDAVAQLPQQGVGGWTVSLTFDSEGARALASASQELYALPECAPGGPSPCNAFAIVLDGVVVSAPRFNEPIIGGQAQIEGNFTAQEARDLANVLSYGALPVNLDVVEVTSVSATIGSDQLRAGLIAGGIGFVIIVFFLLFYYRVLGIVAVLSLVFAGSMAFLAFVALGKTVGFTLTLAGVAGAIVSIGLTADSFIIYFERIRDALRDGKSMRQAAEVGWASTRRTILAADFVTLLAAIVLYIVSVGNVRGFAFTLGLITLIDLLVAFLFTYPITVLLCRAGWMQRGSWLSGLRAVPRDQGDDSAATDAGETQRDKRSTVEVES